MIYKWDRWVFCKISLHWQCQPISWLLNCVALIGWVPWSSPFHSPLAFCFNDLRPCGERTVKSSPVLCWLMCTLPCPVSIRNFTWLSCKLSSRCATMLYPALCVRSPEESSPKRTVVMPSTMWVAYRTTQQCSTIHSLQVHIDRINREIALCTRVFYNDDNLRLHCITCVSLLDMTKSNVQVKTTYFLCVCKQFPVIFVKIVLEYTFVFMWCTVGMSMSCWQWSICWLTESFCDLPSLFGRGHKTSLSITKYNLIFR